VYVLRPAWLRAIPGAASIMTAERLVAASRLARNSDLKMLQFMMALLSFY
jgi:hypothetical protein